MRSDLKMQARGIEMTQILFQNPAKVLQNLRNFGALSFRRKKLRGLGQRALRKSCNIAAALGEVKSADGSEYVRVRRRDHAKFAQKFHERN